MRFRASLAFVAATLLVSPSAFATVTEPNGLVVPRDSMNGEIQLYTFFQQQNEAINWQTDAHTTPDTFAPLCSFTATFILHQAAGNFDLGWYNVDPNATTAPTSIYVIVPAGTPVGTQITSAQIKSDPNYKGGLIGFALLAPPTHYTEQKWNVVCSGCQTPGPWALAVAFKSQNFPNSYYVTFEDGPVDTSNFNNDGDFNDDVYLFSGLSCPGGGQPCDTMQPGVCGEGLTECDNGGLTCKQVNQPSPEKCDALDNNCNGQTDEGNLCPVNQVCYKGKCVAKCGSVEFPCAPGLVCGAAGYCVDPLCANVNCPTGQQCIAGKCKAPCDGVVCPQPYTCVLGVCVDPCSGVTCPSGQVCDRGVCVTGCDCAPCATGLACDTGTQKCTDPSCVGKTCAKGETCQGGKCVPACTGAVCPSHQVCETGQCVDIPSDGGVPEGGSGGLTGFDGGGGGPGGPDSGGANGAVYDLGSKGCGCDVAPSSVSVAALAAMGAVFAAAFRRKRR